LALISCNSNKKQGLTIDSSFDNSSHLDKKDSIPNNNSITVEGSSFDEIKTKFSSNLRPNKPILLNQIYTDTIEFSSYDDNGDYFLLNGKMNGKGISLIYNWDWRENNKYNFRNGDIIKIKWEMKSFSPAGDEEIINYREKAIDAEKITHQNKEIKFLWRAEKFDAASNQNINSIFINKSFINSMSNQEKAALGYVATFIGNECSWDEEVNENSNNLKCEILTALDLGYQCSEKHLGFLQNWFSKDTVALKKIGKCQIMPNTATIQTAFDEILIFTDQENKTITVNYKTHGVNIRESTYWSWIRSDYFKYDQENITLIESKKTKPVTDKVSVKELMLLTKFNAVKKFGTPSAEEQFMLDDAQGGFRNNITDKYTAKEKQSESILITEVTWEKDENNWITVWYETELGTSTSKHTYIWKKGTAF